MNNPFIPTTSRTIRQQPAGGRLLRGVTRRTHASWPYRLIGVAVAAVMLAGCMPPPGVTPAALPAPDRTPPPTALAAVFATATATIPPATATRTIPVPTATRTIPTATATATIPATTATATIQASSPTPVPTELTPLPTPTLGTLDQMRRAELFDKVWQTVADHYLYTDFRGINWTQIKRKYRPQALAAPSTQAFYDTIARMIAELGDQHSRYENPQAAFIQQALATGKDAYVGIGILTVPSNDGLLVNTVFPRSPAADAGIKRRDMIVAVDGQAVNPDDTGISGPAGTTVKLDVTSPGGISRTITLQRRAVLAEYVPEAYVLPQTRIGYLLIQSFWAQDMADKTTAALKDLLAANGGKLDGLIIDVRGNGGGWRTVLEGVLGNFVQGDVGAFYSQTTSYPLKITASEVYDQLKPLPLVVLVDRDTESYAEVFAAALQAAGRAKVVGVTTAGNTETIFGYDLDDGSRLWVAQEGFKLPDGVNLEGRGVIPDRTVSTDWTRFSEARDPQIVKALEVIEPNVAGQPQPGP